MKKSLLVTLIIFTMLFVFIPVNKVQASTPLEEIRITGNVAEILEGELGGFSLETSTECATLGDIRWVKEESFNFSWEDFGSATATAVNDDTTFYGLRLEVTLSDDYEFSEETVIYYNDRNMNADTDSGIVPFDGGGYVYIDLGKAQAVTEYILKAKTYNKTNGTEGDVIAGSFTISDEKDSTGYQNDIEIDVNNKDNYTATAYPADGFRFLEWREGDIDDSYESTVGASGDATYNFSANRNMILYAVFEEENDENEPITEPGEEPGEETQGKDVKYELPSINKQATAIFYFTEGHEFEFNFNDVLKFDPAFVEENMGVPADMFNAILEAAKKNTEKYGTMLCLYSIEINGVNNTYFNYSDAVQIRIKMTPEMKEYDSFKLVYLDEENDFAVSEVVGFTTIEGDEIVFDLKHLSAYALVGEKTEATDSKTEEKANPKTGDSIIFDIVILVISITGLVYTNIAYKNKDK